MVPLLGSVLIPDVRTQALKKVVLKADAYFRLRKDEREVEFYLEVDNGTMPLTRLVEKLKAYQIWKWTLRNTDSDTPPKSANTDSCVFEEEGAESSEEAG